jgi:hypothetical protein
VAGFKVIRPLTPEYAEQIRCERDAREKAARAEEERQREIELDSKSIQPTDPRIQSALRSWHQAGFHTYVTNCCPPDTFEDVPKRSAARLKYDTEKCKTATHDFMSRYIQFKSGEQVIYLLDRRPTIDKQNKEDFMLFSAGAGTRPKPLQALGTLHGWKRAWEQKAASNDGLIFATDQRMAKAKRGTFGTPKKYSYGVG